MKITEIGTVLAAGILSLGALVFLEMRSDEVLDVSPSVSASSFEDTSRIVETSLPAPTAEPPLGPETAADLVTDSAEPVSEEIPPATPVEIGDEPFPILTELGETPPAADDSSASIAGVVDEPGTSQTFTDTFSEAIAEAAEEAESAVANPVAPRITTDADVPEGEEPVSIIEETATGFWLRQAKLNDVFQHLAQLGNHQYFHNANLEGPNFVVTGQLMDDDPIRQMEELALMYGVTIHMKGNTVYALDGTQLAQLPTEPFRYQLKYLRPTDIEQIKLILQPFLTPGSGIIEYETKTNTLIVMDNSMKLDALAMFLEQIDQPKQQIAIETRILRVASNSQNQIGVDWNGILGSQGLSISGSGSLNSLFNLPELDTVEQILTATGTGNSLRVVNNNQQFESSVTQNRANNNANLVLSPVELSVVLRALNSGGLAQQESSPTLITEDNEEGLIAIIDRIPIITSTVSETTAGQNITEEVRYSIDSSDPVGDPATTREIGVTVAVTPTILPDDTIRMSLRPRSAQIVDFVQGATGNSYPRVNESTVTTTARVPNGHSLLIGGFYEESTLDDTNKVPILGDLPAVNLLFKSTSKTKDQTSLVFVVTPKLYRPESVTESDLMAHEIHESHVLPTNHDYPDPNKPGHSYRTNFSNTANNLFNKYEPDAPTNILNPAHPYNLPQSQPVHGKHDHAEPTFESPSVTVKPVNGTRRKGGLFGKMFGGNRADGY